jgi:cytochrome b561
MKKWSLGFRVWHWLNALVIFGILITVFLRESFLNKHTVAEILTEKLAALHLTLGSEQAITVAKAVRAPMWEWHIYLGYALIALLVYRIVLFGTPSGKRSYVHFMKENIHKKMVKLGYLGIYAALAGIVLTGLMLNFHDLLGLDKAFKHSVKELHELAYIAILLFVPLHIAGVAVAENRDEKGILSDMVNGGKQ